MVLIPFVEQVFGNDMNPHSLCMKMYLIQVFTGRSFSFTSRHVFEKNMKITEQCFQESCVNLLYMLKYCSSPEMKL